jgi:tape measure domain-containing protein
MPAKPLIDYGISISLDSSGLTKGEREAKRVADRITRNINKMRKAESEYQHAVKQLENALRKGRISKAEYNRELARETLAVEKARGAQQRYERAIERQTQVVNKNTQAKIRNSRTGSFAGARGNTLGGDLANAGGNIASALGLGGAVAGGARMAGLATGGLAMASVGGIGLTTLYAQKAYKAYAKFEDQLIRLKVLFGKGLGSQLNEEFRDLALNTALSRDAITEAAVIWRSYGLTAEGITERVRRMGEVTGGSAERMRYLAAALAQVNNAGYLMGGEKNQLINAGFNLQEVANAAGIQMSEFKQAMEEGRISAEHVNQALVAMTSKGGTHFGYLNEKAKTLNGRMEKLGESVNELFIDLGREESGFFASAITGAERLNEHLRSAALYWGMLKPKGGVGNAKPEITRTSDFGSYGNFDIVGGIPGVGIVNTTADLDGASGIRGPGIGRAQELERQRQAAAWNEKEAMAGARQGTPEYDAYWKDRTSPDPYRGRDQDIIWSTQSGLRPEDWARAGSAAASYASSMYYGDPTEVLGADSPEMLESIFGKGSNQRISGATIGSMASNAWNYASGLASDAASSAAGYAGQFSWTGAGNQRAQDRMNRMLGIEDDKMPPSVKKIMEGRAGEIAKLDEQAKRQQLGKSFAAGGTAGAGQEYEYLAKQRKVERQYEEQKKRDKERNDKLDEINERAKEALQSQLETDVAAREFFANSGSL